MIVKESMEHYDSSKICADCVNKECKNNYIDYMTYSADCERYECTERLIEDKTND